jgi:endonuclease YncB( thermonuclease family)
MPQVWRPMVRITSVTDGDTFRADLDLGWGAWHLDPRRGGMGSFRLQGIDAPERGTPEGTAATEYLRGLLPVGDRFQVFSYDVRWEDNFGRTLADVLLPDGRFATTALIEAGHAVRYWPAARPAEP